MTSLNMTSMDPVLKQLYKYDRIIELAYENHPLLAMLRKDESFTGRNKPIPIRYGRPQGRSAAFSTAQTNATPSKFEDFLLTMSKNYGVATIDGMTADLSESSRGAFISAMVSEIDGILQEVARDLSRNLFRKESGTIGQVGTYTSGTSFVLKEVNDVVLWEVGMEIVAAATETGAVSTKSGGGSAVGVAGVDRTSATITGDEAWSAIDTGTAFADDLYLFVEGDALNGGTSVSAGGSAGKLAGLSDWLLTASSATSFFGVDRSADSRLWGVYHDGSSDSREDALINAQSKAAVESGVVDCIFMNNADYRALMTDLGSKVEYQQAEATSGKGKVANIAFRTLLIQGDNGPIKVIPDPDCPKGTAFGLEMKCWLLSSAGSAPKILMRDGLRIQRQASADGYEVRVGYYANLSCDAPGHNVRIALPS